MLILSRIITEVKRYFNMYLHYHIKIHTYTHTNTHIFAAYECIYERIELLHHTYFCNSM